MPSGGLYDDLQRANKRSTRLLLAGGVLVVAVLVWVIFGIATSGAPLYDPILGLAVTAIGTAVGLFLTFIAYRSGPSIALRASKARPVSREEAPELWNVFDEVCVSAGISGTKPKLYIVNDPAPNAFATGLKLEDSHIAVTTGLVERLPRYELRAVLAHEVAHILNDDIRAVTVAVATAGLVALLADVIVRMMWLGGGRGGRRGGGNQGGGGAQVIFLVLGLVALVLAPLAAQLIRFAVSRQREYLADATAADVLRDPQSMVNALRRIDGDQTSLQNFEVATAHMWFEEPNDTQSADPSSKGGNKAAKMARRFATHPSMRERIERLATLNAGTVSIDAPLPPPPGPRQMPGQPQQQGQPQQGRPQPPGPGQRPPGPGQPPPPPGAGQPPSGPPRGPGGLPPFPGQG